MRVLVLVLASVVALAYGQMPGGWSKQDVNDGKWLAMLTKLNLHNGLLTSPEFSIKAVESQVVSGANYKITLEKMGKTCFIIIWEQAWMNKTEVSKDTCEALANEKRQLGGVTTLTDFSEPGVKTCIGSMLDEVNAQSNSYYRLVDSNIIEATRQVVSGWMYGFKMQVAPSSCVAGEQQKGLTATDCAVKDGATAGRSVWSGRCWYQDWMNPSTRILDLKMGVDVTLPDKPNVKPDSGKDKNHILGGDDHDKLPHGKPLLGGDGHDQVPHGEIVLGGDDHDKLPHGKPLLGGDDHDQVPHGDIVLGGDGHDLVEHGKKLLGGDFHDLVEHGKKLLGGDGHDLVNHLSKLKNLIGGDDHDYKDHVQKLLGQDGHDLVDHVKKLIGGDDHDYQDHVKKIIGGDDHDLVKHIGKLIGGDDHDYKAHVRKLLGGDGHDYVQHAMRQGKTNGTKKLIGGDGHDLCHYGIFKEFQMKYRKQYELGEEEKRFAVFCDNMRKARKLQETERGTAIYGASKFADLKEDEFLQYVGKPWDLRANDKMKRADIPKGPVPDAYDWRDHGAVTPVKNQGSCGSCWAFSTTGNIEGQWAIKKGKLVSLSEQELVDCDKVDDGCNGGLPSNAYKEIERLGGLETETEYKYVGEDEKCQFKKQDVKVFINDSVSISANETDMAAWLAKNGPISIGINAMAMQFYMGGVSHPWSIFCNPKNLDHGVLIVGYGVQGSEPYWIVKNSWGPDWGEKGYYLVYRGDGVCGLNTMCTSAVVG